jgi:pimeloyl-ACP methyl ester carboxylesterase
MTFKQTQDHNGNDVYRCCSGPGGLRPIFDVYRATFENIEFDKKKAEKKLTMPVLAIGSVHFIGEEVHRQAQRVAENVTCDLLDCGHSLALERPEQLAKKLREFMG